MPILNLPAVESAINCLGIESKRECFLKVVTAWNEIMPKRMAPENG